MPSSMQPDELAKFLSHLKNPNDDYTNNDNSIWSYLHKNPQIELEKRIKFVITVAQKYKLVPIQKNYELPYLKGLLQGSLQKQISEDITKYLLINLLSILEDPPDYRKYDKTTGQTPTYLKTTFSGHPKLAQVRTQAEASHPAVQLIGVNLSPSRQYMSPSVAHKFELADSETYIRSNSSPAYKSLGTAIHDGEISKGYGERAHVGAYRNTMQALGDFSISKPGITPATSVGNGDLYSNLLTFRCNAGRYIIQQLSTKTGVAVTANSRVVLKHITAGCYFEYPCLMIFISQNTIPRFDDNYKPTETTFEEWVNILGSVFVGILNYLAYSSKIPIEITRRSSFGFLIPTLSPTGNSFRVNIGIFPQEYSNLIAKAIIELNSILTAVLTDELPLIPKNIFYNMPAYKTYLASEPKVLSNFFQLLWEKIDTGGKSTLYNLARTSFILEGIGANIFNSLIEKYPPNYKKTFINTLVWAVEKIKIEGSLTVKQNESITYKKGFSLPFKSTDDEFWSLIHTVLDSLKLPKFYDNSDYKDARITLRRQYRNISSDFFDQLDLILQLFFSTSVKDIKKPDIGDGFGSDSDTESEVNHRRIFSKKIIIQNGMQAIWMAVKAASLYCDKRGLPKHIFLEAMYYEVVDIVDKNKDEILAGFRKNTKAIATLLMYDITPCITDGNPSTKLDNIPTNTKIMLIDTTSGNFDEMERILTLFSNSQAELLFFASSGFKHEQLGTDKNPYGTLRIVSKNKLVMTELYAEIKKHYSPITSTGSHQYRKIMKSIGTVPTSHQIFK